MLKFFLGIFLNPNHPYYQESLLIPKAKYFWIRYLFSFFIRRDFIFYLHISLYLKHGNYPTPFLHSRLDCKFYLDFPVFPKAIEVYNTFDLNILRTFLITNLKNYKNLDPEFEPLLFDIIIIETEKYFKHLDLQHFINNSEVKALTYSMRNNENRKYIEKINRLKLKTYFKIDWFDYKVPHSQLIFNILSNPIFKEDWFIEIENEDRLSLCEYAIELVESKAFIVQVFECSTPIEYNVLKNNLLIFKKKFKHVFFYNVYTDCFKRKWNRVK